MRPQPALFVQTGGVTLRAVGEDIFLVKPSDAAIFHLNAVAANLWRLLEQPTTLETAINAVRQASPMSTPANVMSGCVRGAAG